MYVRMYVCSVVYKWAPTAQDRVSGIYVCMYMYVCMCVYNVFYKWASTAQNVVSDVYL